MALPELSLAADTAEFATELTTSAKAAEAAEDLPETSKAQGSANQRVDVEPATGPTGRAVAVMVVGKWKWFTANVSRDAPGLRSVSEKVIKKLKEDGISSVLTSQLLHVLRVLQHHGDVPDFLLCVDQVKDHHAVDYIAEAWAFEAKDQVQRIKECLKRVLLREERVNTSYEIFVRLRPDLLLLSDLPWSHWSRASAAANCVGARLRAAMHIEGLTNEHLSWCYCGKSCCAKGALKGASASYIADDMLTVAKRATYLELWQGKVPGSFSPPWIMQPMAETGFTTRILHRGFSVCPLALRALPIGSPNPHASEMAKCGYLEGSAAIPQSCGAAKASVDEVPWK